MPAITASLRALWREAQPLSASVRALWTDAQVVTSRGSPYTAPAGQSASAGTPNTTPAATLGETNSVGITHAIEVRDLRDNSLLAVTDMSLDLPDGAALWTVTGSAPLAVAQQLQAGEQPPLISVQIHSQTWEFVIEDVSFNRAFASNSAGFSGRSPVAVADAPYQAEANWTPDAPTTFAQICDVAQTYTGVTVSWRIEDGLVPADAFTLSGTPWSVVTQLAAAVGAVVEPALADASVEIRSRYPTLPQEWAETAPDWQIPWSRVIRGAQRAANVYDYNAITVVGSGAGSVVHATLAGTSGAVEAPMITDERLTDLPLLIERARSVLGAVGKQVLVSRTLQVPTEGVVMRSSLVRWVGEEAAPWTGMVRGVRVDVELGVAWQTLSIERHTAFQEGSAIPPAPPPPPPPPITWTLTMSEVSLGTISPVFTHPNYPSVTMRTGNGLTGLTVTPEYAYYTDDNMPSQWANAGVLLTPPTAPLTLTQDSNINYRPRTFDDAYSQPQSRVLVPSGILGGPLVMLWSVDVSSVSFQVGSLEFLNSLAMYGIARNGTVVESQVTQGSRTNFLVGVPTPPGTEYSNSYQTYTFAGPVAAIMIAPKNADEAYGIDYLTVNFATPT